MSKPEPRTGQIIRFDYLWYDEKQRGREEGTKTRPCAVILAAEKQKMAHSESMLRRLPIQSLSLDNRPLKFRTKLKGLLVLITRDHGLLRLKSIGLIGRTPVLFKQKRDSGLWGTCRAVLLNELFPTFKIWRAKGHCAQLSVSKPMDASLTPELLAWSERLNRGMEEMALNEEVRKEVAKRLF